MNDHHPEQHSLNVQQMKLFYASAVAGKEKHILHRKLRNYELKCSAGLGIESKYFESPASAAVFPQHTVILVSIT